MTRLARFAWLVLAWNLVVILWGAFVRATGAGAGCGAHWPLCNGEVLPRSPAIETMIEFLHRATSGLALLLVLLLVLAVFRARAARHPARRAAAAALAFILLEAALGAALVLFRLVAANESVARALFMALHLVNTLLLLAALSLTAHWCDRREPLPGLATWREAWLFGLSLCGLVLVGTSGAIAALGDTLYPAQSLLGGLAQDLSATGSALVRLRLAHPVLALAGALLAVFAAARVLQASDDATTRRAAWTVPLAALAQLAAGLLNLALLAPVWMQLVHLLLADVLWIALVLLAARALALPRPPGPALEQAATLAA
jgi:heme a synthase